MIKRSLLSALLLALSAGIAGADGNTAIYDPVTGLTCSSSNACPWLGGGTAGTPSIVTQSAVTWTQTLVTLNAATSTSLIAANPNRKALRWMVTGTNPMTVVPGAGPAVANSGMNYNGNAGTGMQGGSELFVGDLSTQAFQAISTAGTTATVWEGTTP